jgi:hypothetical protein
MPRTSCAGLRQDGNMITEAVRNPLGPRETGRYSSLPGLLRLCNRDARVELEVARKLCGDSENLAMLHGCISVVLSAIPGQSPTRLAKAAATARSNLPMICFFLSQSHSVPILKLLGTLTDICREPRLYFQPRSIPETDKLLSRVVLSAQPLVNIDLISRPSYVGTCHWIR